MTRTPLVSQQYSNGDVFTQISDVTKPLSHTYNYEAPADVETNTQSNGQTDFNKPDTFLTPLVGPSCRSQESLKVSV